MEFDIRSASKSCKAPRPRIRPRGLPGTKTALCIVSYSVFLALIPIPEKSIFEEMFAACFIGGILCGIGAGLPLTAGCSGGGEEILGLLCMQQKADFSVGRIAMLTC